MADVSPLMAYDPAGKAPILSYNVPEPTQYTGRNMVFLEFDRDVFNEPTHEPPAASERMPIEKLKELTDAEILVKLRQGDPAVFPNIVSPAATHSVLFSAQSEVHALAGLNTPTTSVLSRALNSAEVSPDLSALVEGAPGLARRDGERLAEKVQVESLPPALLGSALTGPALSPAALRPRIPDLDPGHIVEQLKDGKRLNVYRSLWGDYTYCFLDPPKRTKPRLALIETYRLSSYLGSFGAGRTVNTFSLLPGEKTTISVKTFRHSETERKSASSILDSCTQESADDFEHTMQNENSDKKSQAESFEYHAEAEAEASWGVASGKVSGGIKGGTSSAREEFAKNVASAVDKHAQKASAKRDVQVNTSSEVKESSGEDTAITRELENINVGRTLNFVFRQLNQEHIVVLHLVDVRVGFFNGYAESVREVPLSRLDSLLEEVVQADFVDEVRKQLEEQLRAIEADAVKKLDGPFIDERKLGQGDSYLRVNPDCVSTYTDETGNEITVPGVITNASKVTMRTDGVIVDSLLGQGNALDPYSAGLQGAEVTRRQVQNKLNKTKLKKASLARSLVSGHDKVGAEIYSEILGPGERGGNVHIEVEDHDGSHPDGSPAHPPH
jgi:hypothetical protein